MPATLLHPADSALSTTLRPKRTPEKPTAQDPIRPRPRAGDRSAAPAASATYARLEVSASSATRSRKARVPSTGSSWAPCDGRGGGSCRVTR